MVDGRLTQADAAHRRWPGSPTASVLVLAALLLTGCGMPSPTFTSPSLAGQTPVAGAASASAHAPSVSRPSASPAAEVSIDPSWRLNPAVTCDTPELAFAPEALDQPMGAEADPDPAAAALRAFLAEPDTPEMPYPSTGWRRVLETAKSVVFLASTGGDPGRVIVAFRLTTSWTLDLTGPCQLHVVIPTGLGAATWELDHAARPALSDRFVRVRARELACASGALPGGRMQPPNVLYTPDGITIILSVRTRPGEQDCQGNPVVPLTVPLREPIGSRRLQDGSTYPPAVRQ